MIYEILLIIGFVGLIAQAFMGLGHGLGHTAHASSSSHAAHGASSHGSGAHGQTHGHGHEQGHDKGGQGPSLLWTMLSPLTLFSLCLGAGAAGMLVHPYLGGAGAFAAAIAGGIGFYALVVRPLWKLVFRFASAPSLALEGAIASTAEAMTRFDAQGQGMVRVTIDGQLVRLLARLEQDEQAQGVIVAPGDMLMITAIDGHSNTCSVSRL